MVNSPDIRRRWWGILFLGIALAMLVVGETVLSHRLGESQFLIYWLVCFAFTALAMWIAFLDVAALRQRMRSERRTLLEQMLEEVARGKQKPRGKPPSRREGTN